MTRDERYRLARALLEAAEMLIRPADEPADGPARDRAHGWLRFPDGEWWDELEGDYRSRAKAERYRKPPRPTLD